MGGAPTEIEMTTTTAPQPARHDGTAQEIRGSHDLPPAFSAGMARLGVPFHAGERDERLDAMASTPREEAR
jgi:hypothetical protein